MLGRFFAGFACLFDRFLGLVRRFAGGVSRLGGSVRNFLQRVLDVLPGFVDVCGRELGKAAWSRSQGCLKAGAQARDLLAGLIAGGLQQRLGIGKQLLQVGDQFVFGRGVWFVGFSHGKPLDQ